MEKLREYEYDFKFYLIPSGTYDFGGFLSGYKQEDQVPSCSKEDFKAIIKAAIENNLFDEKNVYELRNKFIAKAIENVELVELTEKVITICDSHLGTSFIHYLCQYALLSSENKEIESVRREIKSTLSVNNFQVVDYFENKKAEENGKTIEKRIEN